ncbi:MAG: adenylate/guanylate cyclase domain-containing protein [Hyphomicrobiaceae bacterium]
MKAVSRHVTDRNDAIAERPWMIVDPDRHELLNARNFDPISAVRGLSARTMAFVFGRRARSALPDSVREAIAADQRRSEILVCLVQLCAIAFFGSFYALTPKAFPADVPFEPVPWVLAVYSLITLLRLWLAIRGKLNPFVLSCSVVVDVAVLMLMIWSFHLQYQQPATIYLKAPTLLYVFILIALRTMRFEAIYVLLAGATALLGWSALVAYAVVTEGNSRLTSDFVEYMTSHSILIGAEVDKLLSITAVTLVLAVAIVRARRLLVVAVSEAHAASELSRFFAPEIAGEIREARGGFRPGDAVTRNVAVMMLDLRDFTMLAARLAPHATMAILQEYQARMVPVIQDHGGSIDKYVGDGIMATFGAAKPSNSFAADGFRALLAVLAAEKAWNAERELQGDPTLEVRVAVTVGSVLFGVTGDDSRLEFTVIGDAVNLAAKLEKHCKTVGKSALSTSEAFEQACLQGFEDGDLFSSLPRETVSGVGGAIDLVAIREVTSIR